LYVKMREVVKFGGVRRSLATYVNCYANMSVTRTDTVLLRVDGLPPEPDLHVSRTSPKGDRYNTNQLCGSCANRGRPRSASLNRDSLCAHLPSPMRNSSADALMSSMRGSSARALNLMDTETPLIHSHCMMALLMQMGHCISDTH
jgi:hypothetical protein